MRGITASLIGLAATAALRGRPERAARLGAAAEALCEASGATPLPPFQAIHTQTAEAARAELGEAAFAAAWAAGQALPADGAIAEALAVATREPDLASAAARHSDRAAGSARPTPAGLTAREAEVLGLIAAGRSNREIAASLVLSVHTVERHIANLYAKIDAHGRAEATAYAFRHGIA
jgi:DNA-binding NarL/FixJ family response regulator